MLEDSAVLAWIERLRSPSSRDRELVADQFTDGVSDWGTSVYSSVQAQQIVNALVIALQSESDCRARESVVNALATFVLWDLADIDDVHRAISLPRPDPDPLADYWADIEDWAHRHELP